MFLAIKNFCRGIFNTFLDLVFNQKCIICSCVKSENFLCKTCLKDVQYLSSFPHRIYREIPIYSCTIYSGVIKKLIHKLKFQHKKNASIPLASILFKYFSKLKLNTNDDFLIIYPSSNHKKSLFRGYEHMYLISKEFKKLSNIELRKNLIKKIKYTTPQYKAKNKYKNIKNSFKINYKNQKELEELQGKSILLLDDITTSGATLEEIINMLLDLNIKNIFAITISKANN